MNKFKSSMDLILSLVVKHQDYLSKHPVVLAKLMGEYDDIHYASRFHEDEDIHDWDNLKYAVLDLEEQVNAAYAELVYDAWGAKVFSDEQSGHPLDRKENKTMDEFVEICLSPEYKYSNLYSTRIDVLDHILCTTGTGLSWNKNGFISQRNGSSKNSSSLFYDFDHAEFPNNILKECTWLQDEEIIKYRAIMNKDKQQKKEDNDSDLKMLDMFTPKKPKSEKYKLCYPMDPKYSNLCTMPENADKSYVVAGIEICKFILSNKKESPDNKQIASEFLSKHN